MIKHSTPKALSPRMRQLAIRWQEIREFEFKQIAKDKHQANKQSRPQPQGQLIDKTT